MSGADPNIVKSVEFTIYSLPGNSIADVKKPTTIYNPM
jgi:hypothetical protein